MINVLTFGSKNFNTSLEELKDYLNFKLTSTDKEINKEMLTKYDILIVHQDCLTIDTVEKTLKVSDKIKILVSDTSDKKKDYFKDVISLPFKISDLNQIVENSVIKTCKLKEQDEINNIFNSILIIYIFAIRRK